MLALLSALISEVSTEESAPIATVVDAFHAALQRVDGKAAMELLAPDAIILESGVSQTREDYEKHHLAKDIAFVSATKTERLPLMMIFASTDLRNSHLSSWHPPKHLRGMEGYSSHLLACLGILPV